jgi:hypothetical protein
MAEIDSCEHLIYFCARQRRDLKKKAANADEEETKVDTTSAAT